MTTKAIFSVSPSGALKLEGQGYSTKAEAEKFIKVFRARVEAIAGVQEKYFPGEQTYELQNRYIIRDVEL